jgi:hypothetical protein
MLIWGSDRWKGGEQDGSGGEGRWRGEMERRDGEWLIGIKWRERE